jgi:hypothetical protein
MPHRLATTYSILHHGVPLPPPPSEPLPPTSDNSEYKDIEDDTEESNKKEDFLPPLIGPLQASLIGSLETMFK